MKPGNQENPVVTYAATKSAWFDSVTLSVDLQNAFFIVQRRRLIGPKVLFGNTLDSPGVAVFASM